MNARLAAVVEKSALDLISKHGNTFSRYRHQRAQEIIGDPDGHVWGTVGPEVEWFPLDRAQAEIGFLDDVTFRWAVRQRLIPSRLMRFHKLKDGRQVIRAERSIHRSDVEAVIVHGCAVFMREADAIHRASLRDTPSENTGEKGGAFRRRRTLEDEE